MGTGGRPGELGPSARLAAPPAAPADNDVLLDALTAEVGRTGQAALLLDGLERAGKARAEGETREDDATRSARAELLERADVVVAPTVPYHYYPAFVEYPGSTGLRLETARDLLVDIVRSLARHGPRRFYVLNTGVSTVRALQPAAEVLAGDGILLRYTDLLAALRPIESQLLEQAGGTHADESETSMMLFLRPDAVEMKKAERDFNPKRPGPFTRNPDGPGTYSPTGTWGDPTRATAHKGERLVTGLVEALLRDVELVRSAPLPTP